MTDKLIKIKQSELQELLLRLDFQHNFYSSQCPICQTGNDSLGNGNRNNGQTCDDLYYSIEVGLRERKNRK